MKIVAYAILTGMAALFFLLAPEIDIAVSRLFYTPGEGFAAGDRWPFAFTYDLVPVIRWSVTALVIFLFFARAFQALKPLHVGTAAIVYLTLSFALGPGLITNGVLKDNMGRARPAQTAEFGGSKTFTPALVISDQCPRNCAFVSGHAAIGFFLTSFAFLMAPGIRRKAAFAGAIALGSLIGLGRIADGGHFLSDIVFAGLINIAVAWALYAWLAARDGPGERFFRRWDERILARTEPGAVIASHAHALIGVVILMLVSYFFIDRPAMETFLNLERDLHLTVKYIADYGRSIFWTVPAFVAFLGLWLASRHPALARFKDRLTAWSMIPLFAFLALSASGIVAKFLKISIGRMRPLHHYRYGDYGFSWFELDASYQSFPSGHAVTVATLMMVFYFVFPRYWPVFLITGTAVIGARVMETAHYLSDVVFGAYLGILITAWMMRVFERSGVDLPRALAGVPGAGSTLTWRERLGIPPSLPRFMGGPKAKTRQPAPTDPS